MLTIRELKPSDAEQWADLRRESLLPNPLSFSAVVPDDERHGFRAWGCEPRAVQWEGEYTDEIYMSLDLRDELR